MSKVGDRECVTQRGVIELFENVLGYTYLGNLKKFENSNVNEKLLRAYLNKKGYDSELISLAIAEFVKASKNQAKSLYDTNKEVYSLLRYGVKKKVNVGDKPKTVMLIDFDNYLDNDFYIAEEVTVKEKETKRPDLVIYVNGIALGVIELKRSTVSISEGIRQNLDNQQDRFIKSFFNTIQLVMAGNETQGLKYGVIETAEKYYLSWKEDKEAEDELAIKTRELCETTDNLLHKHLMCLCNKERFIEIIHDFIVFDRGIKKTCRPNQYFGVRAAQKYIDAHKGGIIWHTQGSGKSLTMVWITKWIMEHKNNSRILVITDREELDGQIEKVYLGVDEQIYRTKSGADLIDTLNSTTPRLMCSLIHKFGRKNDKCDDDYKAAYDDYLKELKSKLPADFKAKGDIYVFVDECHRTQSGKLHEAMKNILPNAMFIGFTGTPLLKKDKKKSIEVFGPYIHKYRFDQAVEDKVVLDLRYEARDIGQDVLSQDKIDNWFESKTKELTDVAKAQLKQRWGTLKNVFSSKSRLEKIAADIIYDMETKDRLKSGRGNAMLVAGSIYEACKYYSIFLEHGFKKCAIVTSYEPNVNKTKGETTGEDGITEELNKYNIYTKMLNGKKVDEFERDVKEKFINEPAQMKLLIVVDKLLTGFDAPPATYLYIDKSMRDHGLFQAVCRVNRLDGEDKEFGYIIDYKDLFNNLEDAMGEYTTNGGALDGYDEEDVKGLLKDRLKCAKEKLDELLERLEALCEPVESPKETHNFINYFCGDNSKNAEKLKENEPKRVELYKLVSSLIRAYSDIANEMIKAGYTEDGAKEIKNKVIFYEKVREEIKLASGDKIDLKSYEPAMRHLIDTYIGAEESIVLASFDEMSLIDIIMAEGNKFVEHMPNNIKNNKENVAETVENNVRRLIIDESKNNPKYYEKLSLLLTEIIDQRKQDVIEYKEYLDKIIDVVRKAKKPEESNQYSDKVNKTPGLRALYDNIGDEELALNLHEDIIAERPDGWRGKKIKERKVENIIKKHIFNEDKVKEIYDIIVNQKEY